MQLCGCDTSDGAMPRSQATHTLISPHIYISPICKARQGSSVAPHNVWEDPVPDCSGETERGTMLTERCAVVHRPLYPNCRPSKDCRIMILLAFFVRFES